MKILREGAPMSLSTARERCADILSGRYAGTLVEIELLARRLKATGVDAEVEHPAR
ncbi:hypothetical protein OG216_14680 [Streptomycetaceae bacterium NBC_01309]